MTTVVLTRPEADSERLSRTLRDQGVDSLVIPIMSIAGIAVSVTRCKPKGSMP